MKRRMYGLVFSFSLTLLFVPPAIAFQDAHRSRLPDLDRRLERAPGDVPPEKAAARAALHGRLPSAQIEFDPVTRGPKWVWAGDGFLTKRENEVPAARNGDRHEETRKF